MFQVSDQTVYDLFILTSEEWEFITSIEQLNLIIEIDKP